MESQKDFVDMLGEMVITPDPNRAILFPVRFEDLWRWILPHLDQDRIERVLKLYSMKKNVIPRTQFLVQAQDIVGENIMKRAVEDMRAGASSSRYGLGDAAEPVHDEGLDGALPGNRLEGLTDTGVVDADELEGEGLVVPGCGGLIRGKGNGEEVLSLMSSIRITQAFITTPLLFISFHCGVSGHSTSTELVQSALMSFDEFKISPFNVIGRMVTNIGFVSSSSDAEDLIDHAVGQILIAMTTPELLQRPIIQMKFHVVKA